MLYLLHECHSSTTVTVLWLVRANADLNAPLCVQMPLYEVPGVWRKCEAAVSALPAPHGSNLPQPAARIPPASAQSSMQTELDPASYWQSIQNRTAEELAKGTERLKLADLTHFAAQVEAACMPEHHPIVRAVHDSLQEACLAISRSEAASNGQGHMRCAWLLQLNGASATYTLKEVASAMKALSWQGLASDAVLKELAEAAKRSVHAWPGTSNAAANHLVDIILHITDSGTPARSVLYYCS